MPTGQKTRLRTALDIVKEIIYWGLIVAALIFWLFPSLKSKSELVQTWILAVTFVVVTIVQFFRALWASRKGRPMPTPALLWELIFGTVPVGTGRRLRDETKVSFLIICDKDNEAFATNLSRLYPSQNIEVKVLE